MYLKKWVEDFNDMRHKEDREVSMAKSKEKNHEDEPIIFKEKDSFGFAKVFPPKLPDPSSLSIPCVVGKWRLIKPYVTLLQVLV